jgi:Uma2 family endonuclease
MTVHTKPFLNPAEYLALERAAETKSEYLDGEMIAMTGASYRHSLITLNIGAELRQQLKGRDCTVHTTDLRVLVPATGLYTYPDVIVVCGEAALADEFLDTLTNPTALIEVLSPSTEGYDRGRKFEHYRSLDSLREYLLVSQEEPKVEQYVRQDDERRWLFSAQTGLAATVTLPSIRCQLALAEIYERVRFEEIASPGQPAPAS